MIRKLINKLFGKSQPEIKISDVLKAAKLEYEKSYECGALSGLCAILLISLRQAVLDVLNNEEKIHAATVFCDLRMRFNSGKVVNIFIPEFKKMKADYASYWWPVTDCDSRLKFMDELISR